MSLICLAAADTPVLLSCKQVTGHKTRSIFDRYNIVVEKDVAEALGKLSTQPPVKEQKQKGQVKQFRRTVKELLKSGAKTA